MKKQMIPLLLTFGVAPVTAFGANVATSKLLSLSLDELMNIEVVTASKYGENIKDTPATVRVVTRQQIHARGYRNILDLLQDLPGVDVQKRMDETIYHYITLRGNVNQLKFLILQDGIKITPPTGESVAVADNYPLYHADKVEILYGPAAAVYGADAFGGVINIITRSGGQMNGVELSSAAGNQDYRYHQALAGVVLGNDLQLLAGAHRQQADYKDLANDYPVEYAPVDAVTFDGRTVVAAEQREAFISPEYSHSFFLKAELGKTLVIGFNHAAFEHLSSNGDRLETALYLPTAKWANQTDTFYGRYQLALSDKLNSETTFNHVVHTLSPESHFNNIFVDFADGYKYAKGRRSGIEQQLQYTFGNIHKFTGGLSYERYYALARTPDLPAPYDAAQLGSYMFPNTDLPITISDINYHNTAAYVQWRAAWSERFISTVGLRYDKNSRYNNVLNPRLGLVYRPDRETTVKLMYGEAFRAPVAVENLRVFGTFSGERNAQGEYISSFFGTPNLELEPEKLRNLELGLSRTWNRRFNTSISFFYSEVKDLIETVIAPEPVQFIPGAQISVSSIKSNLSEGVHYGAEFSFNYQQEFKSGIHLDAWGNYSYIDGYVRAGGEAQKTGLPYVAQHKIKLGLTLSYLDRYYVTPKLYLIGDTNTTRIDPDDPRKRVQTPAYTLLDLRLGVSRLADSGLSAELDVYNLLDRRYYNAGGVTTSATFTNTPQPSRTVVFSLNYQF